MKNFLVAGAAVIGFIAPLTVAWASGVKFGTESAGMFLAFSWLVAIVLGCVVKGIQLEIED